MTTDPTKSDRKAKFDALLLSLPGVSARKINGLDAYFVSDKMFACISSGGAYGRRFARPVRDVARRRCTRGSCGTVYSPSTSKSLDFVVFFLSSRNGRYSGDSCHALA